MQQSFPVQDSAENSISHRKNGETIHSKFKLNSSQSMNAEGMYSHQMKILKNSRSNLPRIDTQQANRQKHSSNNLYLGRSSLGQSDASVFKQFNKKYKLSNMNADSLQ